MAGRAERSRTALQCDAEFPRPRCQKRVERPAMPACGQAGCSTRKPASGKPGSGQRPGYPARRLASIARSKGRPKEPSHRGSQRASETRPARMSPSGSQAIPTGCQSSDGNARAWVRRRKRRCRHGARLWHDAYNARRGYTLLKRGRVVLGATPTIAGALLPSIIQQFRTRWPGIEVALHDDLLGRAPDRVHLGEIDFAVTPSADSDDRFDSEPLSDEEFVLVAPRDHPLVQTDTVTLAQASRYPLLTLRRETATREMLARAYAAQGLPFHPSFETHNDLGASSRQGRSRHYVYASGHAFQGTCDPAGRRGADRGTAGRISGKKKRKSLEESPSLLAGTVARK